MKSKRFTKEERERFKKAIIKCVPLQGEIFKQLEHLEFFAPSYEISNFGRIISYRSRLPKLLKGTTTRAPYNVVNITTNLGKHKIVYVHDLVCATFLGPKPPKHWTHHKNGNTYDDTLNNLEYSTASKVAINRWKRQNNNITKG